MIRRPPALLLSLTLLMAPASSRAGEARFMTQPDVRGERIAFAYEGDLYLTGLQGGTPVRLTSHPAGELAPKFSPDGRWLAYSTFHGGGMDVWVMPAEGGTPKRLTWPPLGGQVLGWTPDSRRVVFRSAWGTLPVSRDQKLYTVSLEATLPEPLPPDRGMNASFSPDGSKLLYVRKGDESYYWKRYKGGRYPDIWLYDLAAKSYKPVTDYVGRNAFPMWVSATTMLFASDRASDGVTNLWSQDLGTGATRQVTRFTDFDVMAPSTDGTHVVFLQDGWLWLMDAKGGAPRRVPLRIPSDDWRLEDRWINPSEYLQHLDVGNDGRTVVLGARGDVFAVTLAEREKDKEAAPRNLTRTPGVREDYPRLSPDGSKVAYFSDASGEYQLCVRDLRNGEETPLTSDLERKVYHPHWSPDGKKLLFGDKDFALWVIDVATRKRTKIDEWHHLDNDEFTWEVNDYAWSPDSRWVAWSATAENRNNVISLYDTLEGRKVALTDDFYDNFNPRFDADGGYLYFLSHRNFEIAMDPFEDDHIVARPTRVMVVALRKGERPPFARPPADEMADKANGDAAKTDADRYRVDSEGLRSRIYPLPVEPGNYFHLLAGRRHVAWSSVPQFTEEEYDESFRPAGRTKWTLNVFSMADEKLAAVEDKIAEAEVSANGEQLVVRKERAVFTTKLAKAYESKKLGREVDLSGLVYRVAPREEWRQIFADTWRWYRDFFYDPGMHGRDWKAIRDKYRPYVEQIRTRQQLGWVLSEMVGELCVSHTYVMGGDIGPTGAPPEPAVHAGLLGADLEPDAKSGRYRFARIYGPTPYFTDLETPLARPDVDVKEGDYLLAIDGQPVRVPENYFRLLQVGKSDTVTLTVGSSPADPSPRTFRVKPARSDREARYARWVSDNVEKTLKLSNGDVGYMHVTAMGGGGIMQFDKFWRAFRYKKGLVVDVRGNGGGWTEYFMIDKLERQQVAFNVLKGMEPYRYPNPASRAHFVVLSNENNGSDGEAFVEHFKARKLGTVVGVPSWGGLVGVVNGQSTIDNGRVEQSNNAFYGREGQWLVENHGADPDVLQDNDPASASAGRDAQLERAVAIALEKTRQKPWEFPARPAYPRR